MRMNGLKKKDEVQSVNWVELGGNGVVSIISFATTPN